MQFESESKPPTFWQVQFNFGLVSASPLPRRTMMDQMLAGSHKFLWCQYTSFPKFRFLESIIIVWNPNWIKTKKKLPLEQELNIRQLPVPFPWPNWKHFALCANYFFLLLNLKNEKPLCFLSYLTFHVHSIVRPTQQQTYQRRISNRLVTCLDTSGCRVI